MVYFCGKHAFSRKVAVIIRCMHEVNFGVAFDNAKTGAKGIVRADDWNGLSEAFL